MTKATKFQPIDVDNIYETAHSHYWGFRSPTRVQGDFISEFMVEELDDEKNTYIVTADKLAKATDEILAGKEHVGRFLHMQCVNDVAEWKESPKYGVPFDAELSDCIIQIACFGEIRYG